MFHGILAAIFILAAAFGPAVARAGAPVIAVASDLQFALTEIAATFEAETGQRLRLAFGSTGNFARQIREGAPFEMFMAADEDFIFALHQDGLTKDQGDLYAIGRLVLIAPHGEDMDVDPNLDGLVAALQGGQVTRFAIANPEHAPYGQRAREVLEMRGIWQDIASHLVLGENVSQAAAFALSGNASGGIIAYALALAPEIAAHGQFALIPDDLHTPLRQRMVLLKMAGPVAHAFYDYLLQPDARAVMARYGFLLPE